METGGTFTRLLCVASALAALASPALADDSAGDTGTSASHDFEVEVKGFLEVRGINASGTLSWENGGLGKIRYGGHAQGNAGFMASGDGALVIEPEFGYDFSAHVVVTAAPDNHTGVDLTEAYLQYKPAPTNAFGVRAKGGFFFPLISLENTSLAWTSPYTLTPSAINSWVGEELRTIGGEGTAYYKTDDVEIDLTGAVFTANDPAGTLLTWRGWSFNDRVAGLFDQLRIPRVPIIQATGILFKQSPVDQPFREIDSRVGFYGGATVDAQDYGKLNVLRYDNNANDHALSQGQWAWHTQFWAAGYTVNLPADIEVVSQYMTGNTSVVTLPEPIGPLDYTDFWSAYGLVSKAWGANRISFRYDHFVTSEDAGDTVHDNTNEHGNALTLAYIYRPAENQRITLEVLHVDSTRPERAALGLPIRAQETQFLASFRLFFNTVVP